MYYIYTDIYIYIYIYIFDFDLLNPEFWILNLKPNSFLIKILLKY